MMRYLIISCLWLLLIPLDICSNNDYLKPDRLPQKKLYDHVLLADPAIFLDKDTFYLYGTHQVRNGFEVFESADLQNWTKKPSLALKREDVYGDQGFWAPQVFAFNGVYYMAYTANEHIAIANSNHPAGPFKQTVKRPFSTGIRAIDPFVFIDDDGKKYLYFVRLQEGNRLFAAQLKEDFTDIIPGTITSCLNASDSPQEWENTQHVDWPVTEGPTVLKHINKYYLFYSANDFRNKDYAVGYAVADHPLGPWEKYSGNPILQKSLVQQNGPGHGDFFLDKTGNFQYVFHTHFSPDTVPPRKTAIIKGAFYSDSGQPDKMIFEEKTFRYLFYDNPK